MKALWIVVFALAGADVHGQGTILFSNREGVLDAPVRNAVGELVPTNSIHVAHPATLVWGIYQCHFPVFHREAIPGLWCECCLLQIFALPPGRLHRIWWNMVILPLSSWIHPVPDWEMERRRRQPRSWTVYNPFAWRAIARGWGLRGSSEPTSC